MQHRPATLHIHQRRPGAEWEIPFAPATVRAAGGIVRGHAALLNPVPATATPAAPRNPAIYRTLGLRRDPFPLLPGPDDDALLVPLLWEQAQLLAAWATGPAGLALVTGSPRSGRSTLVRVAARLLVPQPFVVRIADPATLDGPLTDGLLLRTIVGAFGDVPSGRSGLDSIRQIRALARRLAGTGQTPVLIVDGAELTGSRLDILRALLSEEDRDPATLRIVATGTPELRDRVRRRRSLAERLSLDLPIAPLEEDALATLIQHRIAAAALSEDERAGARGRIRPLAAFSPDAVAIVAAWSGGVAGPAIELAGECLLEAIARGGHQVDGEIAHDVSREFTDRARDAARHRSVPPQAISAVQARFSFPVAFEEENTISGGTSPATKASHGAAGGQQ